MLIKRKPQDFVVRELVDWKPQQRGAVSVYELTKRKVDTFDAVRLVAAAARIPLDRIHYAALKDRQAVTTQLISVTGGRLPSGLRLQGIKVRYLGRAEAPLGAGSLRGNAFEIVIRDLSAQDAARARERLERTLAHGLINYFDDQRFGSLAAGQGMVGRDLVQGDHEAAVRRMLTAMGDRDPLPEKAFKTLVRKSWGNWDLIASKWGNRRGAAMVRHLRKNPGDFTGAMSRLPAKERAIHVFGYQSLIWNESVCRYLRDALPARKRSTTPYAGGEHVWMELEPGEHVPPLPATWPLIDHQPGSEDAATAAAIDAALAAEGLTRAGFKIEGIPGCFFKRYERDLVVRPQDLTLSAPEDDDLCEGRLKQRLTFALGPGSYATLVVKRLYGAEPERGDRAPAGGKGRGKRRARQGEDPDARQGKAQRGGKAQRKERGRPAREERGRPAREERGRPAREERGRPAREEAPREEAPREEAPREGAQRDGAQREGNGQPKRKARRKQEEQEQRKKEKRARRKAKEKARKDKGKPRPDRGKRKRKAEQRSKAEAQGGGAPLGGSEAGGSEASE
ncbi:MAG: tRNA pseudouridine(13) synthase TruD [Planctomycetota bacterium]